MSRKEGWDVEAYIQKALAGDWDALRMRVALVDDGCGGAYRITMQYFLEAAEGHGARFDAMLRTFTVGGAQTIP